MKNWADERSGLDSQNLMIVVIVHQDWLYEVQRDVTLPLKDDLFTLNHVTDLLPVNLVTYKMFLQLYLLSTAYFSSLLFPPSHLLYFTVNKISQNINLCELHIIVLYFYVYILYSVPMFLELRL